MQTLLHLTPCVQKSVFKLCYLSLGGISCYRGNVVKNCSAVSNPILGYSLQLFLDHGMVHIGPLMTVE